LGVKTREPVRTRINIGYFFKQPVLSPGPVGDIVNAKERCEGGARDNLREGSAAVAALVT